MGKPKEHSQTVPAPAAPPASGKAPPLSGDGPGRVETEEISQATEHLWWNPLVEFAVHIIIGAIIFLIIATPAVGLDLLLKWLPSLGVSNFILNGLSWSKKALFSIDMVLFLVYLINTIWLFIQKLNWWIK